MKSICGSRILCAALFGAGLTIAMGVVARADSIAYDNCSGIKHVGNGSSPGLQYWGHNLGLDFTVNKPITITALGAFDNGDSQELLGVDQSDSARGVTVAIFNSLGVQIGASVHFDDSNLGDQIHGDAFLAPAAPIVLARGTYSVVAFNDRNYNSVHETNTTSTMNDGGGAITFVGGGRYDDGTSLAYPTIVDGGPVNRYDAGTFQYAVPLPSSAGLGFSMLGGAGLLAALRKRMSCSVGIV